MNWVLLFFCTIFGLLFFLLIILIFSDIRLNIKKLNIRNVENEIRTKLVKEIEIFLEIYLFGRLKIAKIRLDNKKFKNFKRINFRSLMKKTNKLPRIKLSEVLNILDIKIDNANIVTYIGTNDVMLTVFVVTFISTILGLLLKNANQEKSYFKILPFYHLGNSINFHLNCIITVKMVHIIHVIYLIVKKGMRKNERASYRRSYDYSYE